MTPADWLLLALIVVGGAVAVPLWRRQAALDRVEARLREPPPRRRPGRSSRPGTVATALVPFAPPAAPGGSRPTLAPPEVALGSGEVAREVPPPGTLRYMLLQAGLETGRQGGAVAALLVAWGLSSVAVWGASSLQAGLFALFLSGLVGWGLLLLVVRRRQRRIVLALPDAVDLIVGGLSAGYELPDALAFAATGTRGPMCVEVRRILGGVAAGLTPPEAVNRFAELVPSWGPRLLARTLQVGDEAGGSLTPSLQRVARSLREHARVEERVRTTSAVGVVSALSIFLLSYCVPLIFELLYPGHIAYLLESPRGQVLTLAALTFQCVGAAWIFWLVRQRSVVA